MRKINFKIFNKELNLKNTEGGMTYVELIIVLSIFAVVASVTLFNYGLFQARVEIKNLATDIAIQLSEAQKNAVAGRLDSLADPDWRTAYGVSFDITSDDQRFIYFADRDSDTLFAPTSCSGECLSSVAITRNNYISSISVIGAGTCPAAATKLDVVFTRPNVDASIKTTPTSDACTISYTQINISSPQGATGTVIIYPSGRIQVD